MPVFTQWNQAVLLANFKQYIALQGCVSLGADETHWGSISYPCKPASMLCFYLN